MPPRPPRRRAPAPAPSPSPAADAPPPGPTPPNGPLTGMAALYSAAAALYRATPWAVFPDDSRLISVTAEALGLSGALISVIGQGGEEFGLVLFDNIDDYGEQIEASDVIQRGGHPRMPPHFVLNFEEEAKVAPGLRARIKASGLEIASRRAYPTIFGVEPGPRMRPLTGIDGLRAEAIARAVTALIAEPEALQRALSGGPPLERTLTVPTAVGEIELQLCVPFVEAPLDLSLLQGPLAALAALGSHGTEDGVEDGEEDEARRALEAQQLEGFLAAPEGRGRKQAMTADLAIDHARDTLGLSIGQLNPEGLRALLYYHLPRGFSVNPAEAGEMIEELRDFFAYLQRAHGMPTAHRCLRVLGDQAPAQFQAALADRRLWGMAKSLMMAGADAGYDIRSRDGIEAWMAQVQGKPLPPEISLPGLDGWPDPRPAPSARSAADKKAVKAKRKAASAARKRNR